MVQRIQSVFLFFVFICSILIFLFPIATYLSEVHNLKFFLCSLRDFSKDPFNEMMAGQKQVTEWVTLPLSILQLMIGIISLITIFMFKRRMLQIRLNYLNIFLIVLLVGGIFYYASILENETQSIAAYGIGGIFPLLSIVFLFLANNFVRRDEKLVRSADRLR
nr:DUF4293 domain-containing protein [Bacteroidota bacterium]